LVSKILNEFFAEATGRFGMSEPLRQYVLEPSSASVQRMIERMFGRKRRSLNSIVHYVKSVRRFTDFAKETPDALLTKPNLKDLIDGFIDYEAEDAVGSTTVAVLSGVKAWLSYNGLDADEIFSQIDVPSVETLEEDRSPTLDELKKILYYCNIRDKTVVEIATSSGLRIGTILGLKVGDVDFDSYPDIAKVTVYRAPGRKLTGKKRFFITFISSEAKKTLLEYLEYRKRCGEQITPESSLIATIKVMGFGEYRRIKTEPKTYNWLVRTFEQQWARILKRAGLAKKGRKFFELHFHTLRKFFETRCIQAGVKTNFYQFWMGHGKAQYLDESYFRPFEEEHAAEYRKVMPSLCIIEAPTISEDDRRKQNIIDSLKFLGCSEETIMKLQKDLHSMTTDQIIEVARRFMSGGEIEAIKKGEEKEDCQRIITEGEHCEETFKQVPETELLTHLKEGWRIVKELKNGEVIISR